MKFASKIDLGFAFWVLNLTGFLGQGEKIRFF
jgi:hypothetical protein